MKKYLINLTLLVVAVLGYSQQPAKLTQEQLDLKRQLYEQQKQKQKTNPDDQNSLQVPPRYPSTETSSQEIARERSQQRIKSIAREPGNIVQEEEAVDAEVEIEETIDDSGFAEHPVLQAQIENYLERTKSSRPGGAAVNNRTRSTSGSTQLSPELQSRRQGNRPAVSLRSGSNNTSTASNAQSTTSTSKTDPKAAWLKRVEAQRKATREALNTATRIESSEPAQEQVIVSSTDQVKYEEPTRTAPSTDQVSQRYVELSVAEPQTVDSQEIMSDMAVDDVEATRIKAENIQSYKKLSANLAESIAKAHLQTIREESKVTPQGEPALAADSLVLVELYQRTDGDNWNSNNGWLVEPVENWHGISLDGNGRVRRINLSYNNLVDSMPSSLGQLDALEELHLQGNLFMGGIPSSFGDMVNLRQLHFSDNNLSGTLPLELFNLTNLTDLDISSNNFFGNFPVEIGNLVNLIFLRLSNNNFFGTLPAELGQLPSLDYLDFSSNNFSGEIPSSFSGLSNLRSLHAWNNNLNGSFPSVIYTMTSLEFLDLGGNLLEDTLSAAIGNLTNLRSFQIYDNNIGGNLPPELGSLSNLDNINASGNEFSGPIPIELGNLINLRWLYLSDNNLSGTLPIELGSLLQLNAIELGFNDFTGQIPLELGQLPNLSQLNLGYNELTGSIPVEFNNLGQLNFLNVDNNNLTTIEFDPSSLTNLNSLNLSNNFFPFSELEPIYQTFGGFIDNYDTKIGDNEPDTALFLESGSIIIDAGVPGSFNTYMWYLDEIPTGAVSSSITASVPGKYRCEVSNSLVTEYIINSRSFLVWDGAGGNATDSSALVDLYNQTDGANWNQNQNWLITPIQFWYGVTTDTTGRVTGIAMNGNNLNGRLPASIDNMDSLQSLQLTDNKIVGVDFDPLLLPSTTTVDLGFNQLDYSELAKFGGVSANVFLNQSKPFSKEDTTITKFAGSTVDLFAGTSDASYDYWWYRDGLLYDTLSGSTLTVSDAGVSYFCEIFDDTVFPTYGYFILSRAFQINDLPISDVSDSLALVAIYNDMGGSAWLDNTGWLTDPVANWYGVSLDVDGRVDNLSLSNNNLIGDLSTAVGDLDSLTFLNMGSNIITGQLPASLFNLPKINFIYLYDNLLSGELPAALGNLTTLTHLQLNNNQLSGSIPIEVGNMTALFSLFLSSNGLSGSIPSQLSNLPSLTELYLDNNNLTGNIPPELGLLNNLFTISVGDNNLSGTLPIELGNIDNLSNINIYNNQFTGTIPAEYDSLSNLSTISAWENRLNGFDADPSNWSFFSSLDINNNDYRFDVLEQLVSSLPLGLNASSQSKISNDTSFTALASDNVMLIATTPGTQNNYEWFRFGGSYGVFNDTLVVTESGEYYCRITNDIVTPAIGTELFTGNFDITIEIVADMADSLALVATYQNMGGTSWFNQGGWLGSKVVDWYGVVLNDAGKVIQLDLNNNNLTGNLAPGIFQFDELRELNLSGNQITGAIPAAIGNLPQLEILDLGFNQLTGSIPIEISQDTLLRWLYLWYNPLTGSLTPELAMLPNLEELILDNCDLSGSIDAAFGNQSSLWSFRVGGNNFDGAIPATFSTLPNLQFLGIQDNNFTSLPDLSTVTSLQALTAYGNLLEFDDFEPLIGSSAVLSIDPQQIIGSTTIEVPGSLVTLDATVGGSANNYQWYFDGMAIDSANDAQYTIANMQLDSAGFYMCEISNDSITPSTNLRLFRDFNVFITLPVANSDSLALVDFYEATQGQEWSDANNWLQAPVAMWEGVTLFDSRVIALDLSRPATSIQKRGLRGGIPPSIADLDSLEWLDLQGNDLSYVSGEFFSLPKLSYLDLSDNRFEGKLSPSIGKMTTLNNLYLGRNDWSGGIPAELFDLVNLRLLSLDAGGFEGRLPASIGNMTKLEALFLNNLELIGDLPSEMGQLGKLETLSLSNTPFTGSLPTEIGNLDSLKVLSITNSPLI
ncbi:MAG: leucine-rich repeat domain-containing protein, partial [Cyclobacteriaceae bacterium]|nr:leucine-rich repeat domain-containing protein [Cyclobacteriaceae bacterium HetDA_MAG_MS6]